MNAGLAVSTAFSRHHRQLFRYAIVAPMLALMAPGCSNAPSRPVVVTVEKIVVQPIPDSLLQVQPVESGPLSQCPMIAASRRESLEKCNAQLKAIKSLSPGKRAD